MRPIHATWTATEKILLAYIITGNIIQENLSDMHLLIISSGLLT